MLREMWTVTGHNMRPLRPMPADQNSQPAGLRRGCPRKLMS